MDDYFLCFDDIPNAERALSSLIAALEGYELSINESKTSIVDLSRFDDDTWSNTLEAFEFSSDRSREINDLQRYFDVAFQILRDSQDEAAMKYAVRRSARHIVSNDNWRLYQAYLIKIALHFPHTLESVCEILYTYKTVGYEVDRALTRKLANDTIVRHARLQHHSEVCWALWLARMFDCPISDKATEDLALVQNAFCVLLALDLQDRRLLKRKLSARAWQPLLAEEGLKGAAWLLAYESHVRGWLRAKDANFCDRIAFFGELKARGVSFFDPNAQINPLFRRRGRRFFQDLGEGEEDTDHEEEYEFGAWAEAYS
jgi:hypothetical protein